VPPAARKGWVFAQQLGHGSCLLVCGPDYSFHTFVLSPQCFCQLIRSKSCRREVEQYRWQTGWSWINLNERTTLESQDEQITSRSSNLTTRTFLCYPVPALRPRPSPAENIGSTILTRSTILPLWFPFAQLASSLSSFTGVAYLVAGSLGPADATGCFRSSGSHSLITSSRFAQTCPESCHTNRNTQLLFLAYCTFTQYNEFRNVPPLSPRIC
jgi:hypothetical protein